MDNVRNQRENVILTIANAQAQIELPSGSEPVSSFLPFLLQNSGLLMTKKKKKNTKTGLKKQEKQKR